MDQKPPKEEKSHAKKKRSQKKVEGAGKPKSVPQLKKFSQCGTKISDADKTAKRCARSREKTKKPRKK